MRRETDIHRPSVVFWNPCPGHLFYLLRFPISRCFRTHPSIGPTWLVEQPSVCRFGYNHGFLTRSMAEINCLFYSKRPVHHDHHHCRTNLLTLEPGFPETLWLSPMETGYVCSRLLRNTWIVWMSMSNGTTPVKEGRWIMHHTRALTSCNLTHKPGFLPFVCTVFRLLLLLLLLFWKRISGKRYCTGGLLGGNLLCTGFNYQLYPPCYHVDV